MSKPRPPFRPPRLTLARGSARRCHGGRLLWFPSWASSLLLLGSIASSGTPGAQAAPQPLAACRSPSRLPRPRTVPAPPSPLARGLPEASRGSGAPCTRLTAPMRPRTMGRECVISENGAGNTTDASRPQPPRPPPRAPPTPPPCPPQLRSPRPASQATSGRQRGFGNGKPGLFWGAPRPTCRQPRSSGRQGTGRGAACRLGVGDARPVTLPSGEDGQRSGSPRLLDESCQAAFQATRAGGSPHP